jgi:hypothetical protein
VSPGLYQSFEARADLLLSLPNMIHYGSWTIRRIRNLGLYKSRQDLGVEMRISHLTHAEATFAFTLHALTRIERRTTRSTRTIQIPSSHPCDLHSRTERRCQEGDTFIFHLRPVIKYPDNFVMVFVRPSSVMPWSFSSVPFPIRHSPILSFDSRI